MTWQRRERKKVVFISLLTTVQKYQLRFSWNCCRGVFGWKSQLTAGWAGGNIFVFPFLALEKERDKTPFFK